MNSENELDNEFGLGLHVPRFHSKILDVKRCHLLSEKSNEVMEFVRNYAKQSKLLPYTVRDHSGFWRFLVIRESKNLNQMMVNFVTAYHKDGEKIIRELGQQLNKEFDFIDTIVHNVNRKKAQIAFGDSEKVVSGNGYISERLGSKTFQISANSFFQTNSLQAEKMYHLISDLGNFKKEDIVFDLYSGTGTIALFIADQVNKVVGYELIAQAIKDAEYNSKLNNIDNCHFIQGDIKDCLVEPQEIIREHGQPSVVIIDPPRSGLHPALPERILGLNPDKIIYVSCNPATLARDLNLICENSKFQPTLIQPIDMFPNTAHCETVVLLQ